MEEGRFAALHPPLIRRTSFLRRTMSEVTRENHNLNAERSTPPRRAVNNNDGDDLAEIDLVGLVTAVLRRWKLCAAICCVMIASGLAYCFLVPTQYQTTSRVFVDVAQLKTTPKDEVQFVLSGKVLQPVFDDFKYGEMKAFAGETEPVKLFRKRYEVKEVPKTSLVEIAFKDTDVKRSAAVNAATAQGYIQEVRDRMRRVLMNERVVLQKVLSQREKERAEATAALEMFKAQHGIVALDIQRGQTEEDLNRVAVAATASSLLAQSGSSRLDMSRPAKKLADREKVEQEQASLKKELVRLDALTPEYERINGRYNAAQAAYQQAFNAVQAQTAAIERVNGDALARVVVPASTDEEFVKKYPAKVKVMAIVVLAALVLSVLVCVVLELIDRTVKTRREFERLSSLAVLAEVKSDGKTVETEKWRTAATLLALETPENHKIFLMVTPSKLKTPISAAVQLATAFAQNGKRVFVVSGAVRWGSDVTLTEQKPLSGTLTCQTARLGKTELDVVTALPRMAEVLPTIKERYDVVLLETAPLEDPADALAVASVDGVQTVIVAELRQTDGSQLSDAMQMLERVKATVVGAILFQPVGRK